MLQSSIIEVQEKQWFATAELILRMSITGV